MVEDRLFATLDTLTREVELGEGQRARVTDTVGFIRKLPHHLVASFRATLEEARAADVLLHVVDASHPDWEGQTQGGGAGARGARSGRSADPAGVQQDRCGDRSARVSPRRVRELHPTAVITSTMRTDGLAPLKARLRELERAGRPTVRVRVPLAEGARLAELYREGEVLSRDEVGGCYEVMVRLEPSKLERLRRGGMEVINDLAERVRLRRASG